MGLLTDLQLAIQERLQADPYFANVPVLTENKGDIEAEIAVATSQVGGLCVVIVTPSAIVGSANYKGLYFEEITVVVRVMEQPVLNRGPEGIKKPSSEVAEIALALLIDSEWPWSRSDDDTPRYLVPGKPALTIGNSPDVLSYDVVLTAQAGFEYTPQKP